MHRIHHSQVTALLLLRLCTEDTKSPYPRACHKLMEGTTLDTAYPEKIRNYPRHKQAHKKSYSIIQDITVLQAPSQPKTPESGSPIFTVFFHFIISQHTRILLLNEIENPIPPQCLTLYLHSLSSTWACLWLFLPFLAYFCCKEAGIAKSEPPQSRAWTSNHFNSTSFRSTSERRYCRAGL